MASPALSNSPSKSTYAFSKDARFPMIKSNTKKVGSSAFDKPSDFVGPKTFNTSQTGFGAHSTRFQYYNTSKKHGAMPSSNSYDT